MRRRRVFIRVDATGIGGSARSSSNVVLRGAGLMLICHGSDGDRVLFVKHRDRGTWEFPGGEIEPGETAEEAALREVREEIGPSPYGHVSLMVRHSMQGVDYSTFLAQVQEPFEPSMADGELEDWVWASPNEPPEPLHPGVRLALGRLRMNELDLARSIASGAFSSPQQYENIWLFAMRVTGTGISYRPELEEYVWRDPAVYLNSEFIARIMGLPVIIEHPDEDELNTDEFARRVIGSLILGYIEGDEVWGIARIYDQDAAKLMRERQLSTSPAVIFRDPSINETRKLVGGKSLLIEGEPSLVDHLAICHLGVWDKGGEPTGISLSNEPEMAEPLDTMPPEKAEARADHAWPWLMEVERLIGPLNRMTHEPS